MIDWLQSGDDAVFRFVNHTLHNGVFDSLMPLASNTPWFVPGVIFVLALLIWKGGVRGRVCAAMLVLGICAGDWLVADSLRHAVGRLRPFNRIADAHVLVGRSGSFSMPSSHALNWFSATIIAFIYYRRSLCYMLPLAVIVSFSRVYNGVHYPSDVLAGAVLGAGCGAAVVWSANAIWPWAGRRWFPVWHCRLPSLVQPVATSPSASGTPPASASVEKQWLNLGFVLIALLVLVRLAWLAAGKFELSEDEAYQWIWSNTWRFPITASRCLSRVCNSSARISGVITNLACGYFAGHYRRTVAAAAAVYGARSQQPDRVFPRPRPQRYTAHRAWLASDDD